MSLSCNRTNSVSHPTPLCTTIDLCGSFNVYRQYSTRINIIDSDNQHILWTTPTAQCILLFLLLAYYLMSLHMNVVSNYFLEICICVKTVQKVGNDFVAESVLILWCMCEGVCVCVCVRGGGGGGGESDGGV